MGTPIGPVGAPRAGTDAPGELASGTRASARNPGETSSVDTLSAAEPGLLPHGQAADRRTTPGGVVHARIDASLFARPKLQKLLAIANDSTHPEHAHRVYELYDAVRNHLLGTPNRRNRVSDLHLEIAELATIERVGFLRDACWTLEIHRSRLPGIDDEDIRDLGMRTQGVGANFDLDDNILFLPTEIMLVHRETGEERGVSTAEFAEIRADIGKRGEWKHYETNADSYRFFRDQADPNVFLEHLKSAMKSGRRGPSWEAFKEVCATEAGARSCTIITARGHYPEAVHEGLTWLRDEGYIAHVPPIENLFGVSTPGQADTLGSDPRNPSDGKARVMEALLDDVQHTAIGPSAVWVRTPDGADKKPMHLWHFSDDDYGTFENTLKVLGEGVAAGRWPDVKIIVSFTGELEGQPKRTAVITSDGEARLRSSSERQEDDRVLSRHGLPVLKQRTP
ncbi:MAG: hypothetical protein AAF658_10730 [Myxococcota bacterium]